MSQLTAKRYQPIDTYIMPTTTDQEDMTMRNLENVINTNPTHLEHMAHQASPKARARLLENIELEIAYREEGHDRPDDWRVNDLSDDGLRNLRSALKLATENHAEHMASKDIEFGYVPGEDQRPWMGDDDRASDGVDSETQPDRLSLEEARSACYALFSHARVEGHEPTAQLIRQAADKLMRTYGIARVDFEAWLDH